MMALPVKHFDEVMAVAQRLLGDKAESNLQIASAVKQSDLQDVLVGWTQEDSYCILVYSVLLTGCTPGPELFSELMDITKSPIDCALVLDMINQTENTIDPDEFIYGRIKQLYCKTMQV